MTTPFFLRESESVRKFRDIGEALEACRFFSETLPLAGYDDEGEFYSVGSRIAKCWGGFSVLRENGLMMYGNPALVFQAGEAA